MKLAKRARSATSSPPKATTKVRPPKSWTYGATWRSQRMKASGGSGAAICSFFNFKSKPHGGCGVILLARRPAMIRTALVVLALSAPLGARAAEDQALGHALTLIETI